MKRTAWIVAVATALALSGCHRGSDPQSHGQNVASAGSNMTLKLYNVPPEQTQSLLKALNLAVGGYETGATARISTAGPGQLLVFASPDAQESIADAIADLAKAPQAATAGGPLNLHFWVIDSQPGEGDDDPSLSALGDVLKAWRTSMGKVHFTQVTSATGAVKLGGNGTTITSPARLYYEANQGSGNDIDLNIDFATKDSSLAGYKGLINTQPGQYTILAQASNTNSASMRLLVLRVDRPSQH